MGKKSKGGGFVGLYGMDGVRLVEGGRDSAGFEFGALVRSDRVTVMLSLEFSDYSSDELAAFEQAVAVDESVLMVETVAVTQHLVASVTFLRQGKEESRDASVSLTRLAGVLPTIARQCGVTARPLSMPEINQFATALYGQAIVDGDRRQVVESLHEVQLGELVSATFDCLLTDELDAVLRAQAISEDSRGVFRYARIFRPGRVTPDDARAHGVFSIVVPRDKRQRVGALVDVALGSVSPGQRLGVRRMMGRQQVGAVASAGLGVTPWRLAKVMPWHPAGSSSSRHN